MRKDDRKMEGERKVVSEMRVDEISRDKEFGGRGERERFREILKISWTIILMLSSLSVSASTELN